MNVSLVFLILTIGSAVAAYIASQQDSKQKDRIENLGEINKQLTEEVEKLSILNNSLASRNGTLADENIKLTNKSNEIIEEVKKLTVLSSALIQKVDTRTEKQSAENALSGELDLTFGKPLRDDDLLMMRFGDGLTLGNPVSKFKRSTPPVFIQLGATDLIPFRIIDDKLRVSLKVFDLQGNWVAEIVDNHWRRNPNNTGKFNYDQRGFEIIDNKGYLALNVDLLANNEIVVQGYLLDKGSGLVMIGGRKKSIQVQMPMRASEIEKMFDEAGVMPIFQYSGKNWIGKRL